MTQYRKFPDSISNHFDRLFEGLGRSRSSFSDVDAIIHNGHIWPSRFLLLEFKHAREELDKSKNWLLKDFAAVPGCQSAAIKYKSQNLYEIKTYPDELIHQVSGDVLKAFIWQWWHDTATELALRHLLDVMEF